MQSNRKIITIVSVLCIIIVVIISIIMFTAVRGQRQVESANLRIIQAIESIEVRVDGIVGDFSHFITDNSGRIFSEIEIIFDFEKMLDGLIYTDFLVARGYVGDHIEALHFYLSLIFSRTNNLTIIERNIKTLNNFELPPLLYSSEMWLDMNFFASEPDNFLRIDASFGSIELYSDLFYEQVTDGSSTNELYLVIGIEGDTSGSTVRFLIVDDEGREFDIQNFNSGVDLSTDAPLSLEETIETLLRLITIGNFRIW